MTIGHLTIEISNPFFASVAEGVERASEEAGYSVFLANSAGILSREARYLELFEEQRVRGLILSAIGDVDAYASRLRKRGIPSVVIDQTADPNICASVVVDDKVGGQLAVEHLAASACRRILFVGGPFDIGTVNSRRHGAEVAAARTGVHLEVLEERTRTIASGRLIGKRIAERDGHDRPDGIFAVNDLMAIGILHGLLQHGIRVPEEIAVVGYDDIDFAADSIIPLTTIRRPAERFGEVAIELLLREINGEKPPSTVVFQPTLVPRASTTKKVDINDIPLFR